MHYKTAGLACRPQLFSSLRKVVSIRVEGLLAQVILAVGEAHVTAIITASAVRELQLKKGDPAAALISEFHDVESPLECEL